jgi:hypothetical protein
MHAAVCVKEGKPATEIRAYMPKPSSTANPATGGNFREGQSGSLAGTVLEKTETSITVKTDGDSPQTLTFIPKWVGLDPDQGGGFNKDMLAAIKATAVKSRVQVQWVFQEHLRVVQLMVGSRP